MNFPKKYYSIEFKLKNNKMNNIENWTKLKYGCENNSIEKISKLWINKINLNINLYFKDNSIYDKHKRQIKFRESNLARLFGFGGDNLIIFNINENEKKYWELNEIDEIINGFKELCHEKYNIDKINISSEIKLLFNEKIYTITRDI